MRLLSELAQRVPPGARVLDAGCGAGVPVTKYLSQFFRVTGIDFSAAQIELASRLVPDAEFLCQDITELTFPEESFDAICSYYAIIHIPRQEHRALIRNFHRMLKPAGLLLVGMGASDIEAIVDEDFFGSRMYWSHYDASANLRMVQECGFETILSELMPDSMEPETTHLFILAKKV